MQVQERMNGIAAMQWFHYDYDLEIDNDAVIDMLARKHPRRMALHNVHYMMLHNTHFILYYFQHLNLCWSNWYVALPSLIFMSPPCRKSWIRLWYHSIINFKILPHAFGRHSSTFSFFNNPLFGQCMYINFSKSKDMTVAWLIAYLMKATSTSTVLFICTIVNRPRM